jgi:hypothetical protein
VLSACLDIHKSICQLIVIPGVVRLLYQDYVQVPEKHNLIYNSVCNKHGG